MSKEKRRVPKLRFPGFTEDWEQRKLGDFYTFKNGLNKEKVYFGYGDSIVNFTDVFHNRQIYSSTLKGKVFVNKKELENFKVKEGDLFFTRTSETIDEIGFPAVVMEPMERVVFSGFVLRGRAEKNDPLVNIFKSYIFFTDNFRSEMKKKSSMTTRALTSGTALKEMYFSYPKDLEEQTKIGEILLRLDNVITLHQRKLDNLKLKKKALLQKLFPKNGERYPELRFPGFTDAWEQRKFSDLYEKISEKNDLSYSLDKIISVANMYYKSDAKVSNEEYLKTYNIFRYGEIAFEGNKSKDFAYGRFVENTIGDGIISHVFEVFRPISKYDIYFWKYYINYEPIMGKVLSRCTKKTTMMTNLVAKDFLKETVLVPTLAEQKQIGTLLNALDKSITLHQQEPFLCGNSVNGGVELC